MKKIISGVVQNLFKIEIAIYLLIPDQTQLSYSLQLLIKISVKII